MKLSVVGLGKLGSPLAVLLATKGYEVKGVDFNNEIVKKLNARQAPFHEEGLQELLECETLKFEATTDCEHAIQDTDATFIIVPTPSDEKGLFTNRYILQALESVGKVIQKKEGYHLVVITSTVMPGSTMGEIRETLEKASARTLGNELGLCYNPEFIALGSVVRDMLYPDMVLIGESDQKAGNFLQSIYESFCDNTPPIQRMNCVNAELTKLSLNTYVTTKISYANMLGAVCEALPDSDVNVVTRAIGLDSRIGRKYLKAAVAFGGPCFPRDNVAFQAMAEDLEVPVDLAKATQQVNDFQPQRLQALIQKLNRGKKIGILGLSYKPGTYVVEESPGIKMANQLVKEGYQVSVFDPMALGEAENILDERVRLTSSIEACLKESNIALIMTNWPEFSEGITPKLAEETACQLIIDCWRTLDQKKFSKDCKVVYLGQGLSSAEKKLDELATVH
ncbi:MAG: UDP-glucose/GDP-mannose dehydrogenase family protein [Simkania sp.]|nr:UDP-glucose/GDP-mannose dehydrogenase family protein [Simkania sp.]